MHRTRTLPATLAIIATATVAALAGTAAKAEGLYVGGSLGTPHYDTNVNGNDSGGTGASGKLYGGWQFNRWFALEGGAVELGHVDDGNGKVKGHGEFFDAVGLLPLNDSFSLLGSAGLAHINLDTSNGDSSGAAYKLGLGAEYKISKIAGLRAEVERYRPEAFGTRQEVDQYSVGLHISF